MSLRTRLSLASAALALLVVGGFGSLAYLLYVRQQESQLHAMLEQDLGRVAALMDRPTLGASLTDTGATGFVLQFVAPDDRVILSWGDAALLPLAAQPRTWQRGERTYLVAHTPWRSTGGTIRLAHDISEAIRSRQELARSLLVSGLLIALVASLGGLVGTRRALEPLERVSRQARGLDPAAPETIAYEGPKDEIHALTDALNTALAAIRARQHEERAFLLEVAHELASPLTLINYHLAAVRNEYPSDSRLRPLGDWRSRSRPARGWRCRRRRR
jgi:two-component system OmpR family sensor kinase